jgi:hypothetical protein
VRAAAIAVLMLSACGFDGLPPLVDASDPDASEVDARVIDAEDPDASGPDTPIDTTPVDAASVMLVLAEVPLRIAVGTTVTIRLTVGGPPGTVAWSLTSGGGGFTPASGQVTLNASGLGTITTSYTAPGTAGDLVHTLTLDDGVAHQVDVTTLVRTLAPLGNAASFPDAAGLQIPPNALYGQRLVVSQPRVVMRLGLWADVSGPSGRLALYTDDGTGPSALVASTPTFVVATGRTEVDVATPVALAAGSYWLLGNFDAGAQLRRGSLGESIASALLPASSPLPSTISGPTLSSSRSLNVFAQVAP